VNSGLGIALSLVLGMVLSARVVAQAPQDNQATASSGSAASGRAAADGGAQKELDALKERLAAMEAEKRTLIMHIRKQQADKDMLAKRVRNLQATPTVGIAELNGRVEALAKKLASVTKDRNELRIQLKQARTDFDSMDQNIATRIQERVGEDRAQKRSLLEELQKERDELKKRISELQANYSRAEQNLAQEISGIQADLNQVAKDAGLVIAEESEPTSVPDTGAGGEHPVTEIRRIAKQLKEKSNSSQETIDKLNAIVKTQADAIRILKGQLEELNVARRENQLLADELAAVIEKSDADHLTMYFNLAVMYDKTKMYAKAEQAYVKCLEINKNDSSVHYNLGILYDDKLGNREKALEHYKRFLALATEGEDADRVREWIANIQGNGRAQNQGRLLERLGGRRGWRPGDPEKK